MTTKLLPILLMGLLTLWPVSASLNDAVLGPDMNNWPQNEARKVKDNFAGWLLVTPDRDWQQKWQTPANVIPEFSAADTVSRGDRLTILTFYVNPKSDDNGHVNVRCSLKAIRPDHSISADVKDIACASGKLMGDPMNVRLSPAVIGYTAEADDPLGQWTVEVTLVDKNRGTTLALRTHFNLVH